MIKSVIKAFKEYWPLRKITLLPNTLLLTLRKPPQPRQNVSPSLPLPLRSTFVVLCLHRQ